MTERDEREQLIEEVTTAFRPRGARGEIRVHPSFADLDEAGRVEAFDRTTLSRTLESALDGEGFSSTVHAVLARIPR